jgi:hypothetical protein
VLFEFNSRASLKRSIMRKRKPSIAELEAILDSDKEPLIFIQPDGSISTRKGRGSKLWKRTQQPQTLYVIGRLTKGRCLWRE